MKKNFEKLEETKHMLVWLSNNPFESICTETERMFKAQSETAQLISFEVTTSPDWLTGGRKTDDEKSVILVRTGVAFACRFTLKDDEGIHQLNGIYSWVGVGLDTKTPKYRIWMDLDGTLEEFGKEGALVNRIYELDIDEN